MRLGSEGASVANSHHFITTLVIVGVFLNAPVPGFMGLVENHSFHVKN